LNFICRGDRHIIEDALQKLTDGVSRLQVLLNSHEWGKIPAQITLNSGGISGVGTITAVITDLSEQFRYREIVREEKLSRSIMENDPDGIAVCDMNGLVIRASRSLHRFCRRSALMKPFDEIFHIEIPVPDGPPELFSSGGVLAGKTLLGIEGRLLCPAEEIYEVSLSAVPLTNEENAVIGCLITITDVTSRKQAEDTLSRQAAKLAAANKELESFAYSVSHDLRTPLRAIDGFSRMLITKIADKLNDDEKRRFEVIRENTQRMGRLIDDLLAFSRLGRQAMVFSAINMSELIHQVWQELLAANPGRSISLKMDTLPPAFGDTALIRQVLVNLLSNAIKFTRRRESALIEIGGQAADSEIVYFVRDNGAGFDMNYIGKLFGVFQRLHTQEEYEGTGAGLAIVQRIILRHSGRVWAEGAVDRGATFYFTLPKIAKNVLPDSPDSSRNRADN